MATVDIVNNGPDPIDGWTLPWTWPTGWQQVSNGWSANWAQSGRLVQVTRTTTGGSRTARARASASSARTAGRTCCPPRSPSTGRCAARSDPRAASAAAGRPEAPTAGV
ncbi:cellulose binding domain-containing protein, partial [Micromonospora sp. NPDC003776]